jgi:hypothetical protein
MEDGKPAGKLTFLAMGLIGAFWFRHVSRNDSKEGRIQLTSEEWSVVGIQARSGSGRMVVMEAIASMRYCLI